MNQQKILRERLENNFGVEQKISIEKLGNENL